MEQNALVVRRFFDEVWTQGRLEVTEELLAPAHIHHLSGADLGGPTEVKALVAWLRSAFPDLRFVIEDEVTAGDRVVIRWTAVATHLGDYDGLPPTGRVVTWTGIDLVRLQDHRIVELWGNYDALGLQEQLRS